MTNSCTCKAEHWQTHAESCPAYKPRPLLTVDNIRSGAIPADAVVAGFLLAEIQLLRDQRDTNLAKEVELTQRLEAEIEALKHDNERLMKSLNAEVNAHEPRVCVVDGFACEATQRCEDCPHPDACEAAGGCDTPAQQSEAASRGAGSVCGRLIFAQHCQKPKGHEDGCEWSAGQPCEQRCLAMINEFGEKVCSLPESHGGPHVWVDPDATKERPLCETCDDTGYVVRGHRLTIGEPCFPACRNRLQNFTISALRVVERRRDELKAEVQRLTIENAALRQGQGVRTAEAIGNVAKCLEPTAHDVEQCANYPDCSMCGSQER